jgi:hypothetical protein
MNEATDIKQETASPSVATDGSPVETGNQPAHQPIPRPINPHSQHHLYLDRWKFRGVFVTAPTTVTKAEMERIKGWMDTLFIIDEEPQVR